ncbi:hypothetical protein RV04_GL002088 [Enterococcus hermanniensis]|uniref:Uncharacterized protein n=1 Tax=Enterococcus hermanniensis TaxID=249189 RepID=A0A1L8TMM5_9ENTE|nr:hypothetical protein RV04_GL002088 [Enterococcus hermanniensis]
MYHSFNFGSFLCLLIFLINANQLIIYVIPLLGGIQYQWVAYI